MVDVPSGPVTFLFTDVVGSTRLWESDPDAMGLAMARHDEIVESAVASSGGTVVRPRGEGDSRFGVFAAAADALLAAATLSLDLASEPWATSGPVQVRVAVHTGEADLRAGDYYGDAVNRCARLRSLAHPGQVLCSGAAAAAAAAALPPPLELLELGEHRLKDLGGVTQVLQLVHPDLTRHFPALQSLGLPRHNLPAQLSSFVGREQAIEDVLQLLTDERLVTITGFGGMGKTRLAIEVGSSLVQSARDGVWFVDLSAVRDASLMVHAMTRLLGLPSGVDALGALTRYLAQKHMVLICDNVEQLLPEAAPIIATIAAAGPDLRVLVTGREALRVRGERVYPLRPLERTTTEEGIGNDEASRLFLDRVAAVGPSLVVDGTTAALVSSICHALDGWPLALELAAARVPLLGLEGLLSRLHDRLGTLVVGPRDVPARQQTLYEAIAWSYELLAPEERTMLRQLSVCASSVTLEAVERVVALPPHCDATSALAGLLDKSFLHRTPEAGPSRYQMFEALREFAERRLEESGDRQGATERHCAYYQQLFSGPDRGPHDAAGLTAEIAGLGVVFQALLATRPEVAADLFLAVQARLTQLGHVAQGAAWCRSLLVIPGLSDVTRARLEVVSAVQDYYLGRRDEARRAMVAPLLASLGSMDWDRVTLQGCTLLSFMLAESGEAAEGVQWSAQSVAVAEALGVRALLAEALMDASYVARLAGRPAEAVTFARRGLAETPQANVMLHSEALGKLCRALVGANQSHEAVACAERAVSLAEPIGGLPLAYALAGQGRALLAGGFPSKASQVLITAMLLFREIGIDPFDLGWLAVGLIRVDPELGARVFGAAESLVDSLGSPDVFPPTELTAEARRGYEAAYLEEVEEGRRGGWAQIAEELLASGAGR